MAKLPLLKTSGKNVRLVYSGAETPQGAKGDGVRHLEQDSKTLILGMKNLSISAKQ